MGLSGGRLLAMALKEFREYRRTRFIVYTMAVLPIFFMIDPVVTIFVIGPTTRAAAVDKAVGATFLLLLVVPAVIPATIAAYSVIGERVQETLEPLLTTPVRREEILLGKALAAIVPSVTLAYILFSLVVICAHFFARNATVAATLTAGPHILAEALFAPLLAAWSIWVGTAVSVRSSDVRAAQQLGTMASLPPLGITALVAFNVLAITVWVAVAFGLGLLILDLGLWVVVSSMFDRERLITGSPGGMSVGISSGGATAGQVRHIGRVGRSPGGGSDS